MIYTEKDIYNIIDFAVNKNIMVYNKNAEDRELTPRLLALLRREFRENYSERPTHLLIDKDHEEDINFVADQIMSMPQETDYHIIRILGYAIDYIDGLQKIAKEYEEQHKLFLRIYDKSKLIIAKNDKISLLGIY